MCYSTVVQVVRDVEQLVHVRGGLDLIKLRLSAYVLKQPSTGQPDQYKHNLGFQENDMVHTVRVLLHGTYSSSTMAWYLQLAL